MNLHHKFLDGRFFNKQGNLIALVTRIFDHTFPSGLLIDKRAFINFLNTNGYTILWTLVGEKQLIGGSPSREDFVGRLEISGAYVMNMKGKIVGNFSAKFNN